jgi:MurNAc alpha-1-phosphate uridylyltransferase
MKAIILSAGRGERMRPLTDDTPKPLLVVRGKALIEWIIEGLVKAGVRDLVINHAHLGAVIEAHLGDGDRYAARIRYSPETEALETAGGIANALDLLGEAPFIAVNGDIYSGYAYAALADRARRMQDDSEAVVMAHLVLVDNPPHNARGDFALRGPQVLNDETGRLTFSGIALYRPVFFAGIPKGVQAKLSPLLRAGADRGQVTGEHFRGGWHDVGTPERLLAANSGTDPA